MDWKFLITSVAIFMIVSVNSETTNTEKCNRNEVNHCMHDVIDEVFSDVTSREHCYSNNTVKNKCLQGLQDTCSQFNNPAVIPVVTPYFNLLQKIHGLSCDSDLTVTPCDIDEAVSCIKDFVSLLSTGSVAAICRQTTLTLKCLSPVKNQCSDVYRYVVALITNELHLTSDLWCSHRSCNLDITEQCYYNAKRSISYPTSVLQGSNLVCSDVQYGLTCMSNHTEFCEPGAIPQYLSDGFIQLLQFSMLYCGTSSPYTIPFNVESDLSTLIFLEHMSNNRWTEKDDICRMFNETLLLAVTDVEASSTWSLERVFTWQNTMKLVVDKYMDICFQHQTRSCDWVSRSPSQDLVCDVAMATSCVDKVLLSKIVIDVYTSRNTWENVCGIAYDMLSCTQYFSGSCGVDDLSNIMNTAQYVYNLVGTKCGQVDLTLMGNTCGLEQRACHVTKAITECSKLSGDSDVCMQQDEIISCFQEKTHDCNSVESSSAQFYLEWLLSECTLETSVLVDDMNTGVAQCKIQFGYNINNGLQLYDEFTPIICTAFTLYQQCLTSQSLSDMTVVLVQDTESKTSNILQGLCNTSRSGLDQSTLTENENCDMSKTSGEIALFNNLFGSFSFLSMVEQERICRLYHNISETWLMMANSCTLEGSAIIQDAVTYLNNVEQALCPVTHQDSQESCEMDTVAMCFQDFGIFSYFAGPNTDICGKLEETYQCLFDNAMGCSDDTKNEYLQEIRAMHGLLGNTTCPIPDLCASNDTSILDPWYNEICIDRSQCLVFGWLQCVEQYNIAFSCQFFTETVTCIEQSLSGCDGIQYLYAKNELLSWLQMNNQFCNVIPNDPAHLTNLDQSIYTCSDNIAFNEDLTKYGICTAINSYVNCLISINPEDILYTWQGILQTNVLMWQKHIYVDCSMSDENYFIIDTDIDLNDVTNTPCSVMNSMSCLRGYVNMAATYYFMIPLSDRQNTVCERSKFYHECVVNQTTGCTGSLERTMLTSVEWVDEAMNNVGTCVTDGVLHRECAVHEAMHCIVELGETLLKDLSTPSLDVICSKLHSTSMCVNEKTSSCDYVTRGEISETFNQVSAVITNICTTTTMSVSPTSACLADGDMLMCDVESALMCIVPIQALLLHQNTNIGQVCRFIPEMQSCIHRATSGCDAVTMGKIDARVHRLSHRLNDSCPEIYCEECSARQCLSNLHRNMQYENINVCGLLMETKECIWRYAGYCSPVVSETLLREMTMIVGSEDTEMCEKTLQSCLQSFMNTAYQIVGYTPSMNISVQNDYMLQQLCTEASTSYYCVNQQMMTMMTDRIDLVNSTLTTIGDLVYSKCNQAPSLRCHRCSNSSSYDECYQQGTELCPPNKQMCGTIMTGTSITKGCVEPSICQTGCNGYMCSMCCGTSLCNEPMDYVITEAPTCHKETALYCAFQLLFAIAMNDDMNCMMLQESVACMIQSTEGCILPDSVSLAIQARHIVSSDTMSTCTSNSTVCACGQCTSMLLLSIISSPFGEKETFCRNVQKMYNQSMEEMDLSTCTALALQTTTSNLQMAAYMVHSVCNNYEQDCIVNGVTHHHGTSYLSSDGCNTCTCNMGQEACTLMYCPPRQGQCPVIPEGVMGTCVEMCTSDIDCVQGYLCCSNGCGHVCMEAVTNTSTRDCHYDDEMYKSGESFLATDGCNYCFCHDSMVGCTKMYCTDTEDRVCDLNGVQECMDVAGLPYLFTMSSPDKTDHVCRSAANMLKCIESKITSCPVEVIDVVHSATWWHLSMIESFCDMHTILKSYLQPNITMPDNLEDCSIYSAMECFHNVESPTCSSYEEITDCVRGHTKGCMSIEMVPVLYELNHYVDSNILECTFEMLGLQIDPLYPIAKCMQEFSQEVSDVSTMNQILYGRLDGLCHHIETYIQCLSDITNIQPVVKMFADNIVNSMMVMLNNCHDISDSIELTECYTCQDQNCEEETVTQCRPNQVCAMAMQLDILTGSASMTKGCADMQWCNTHQGCDTYSLSCSHCCHGDKCNDESNVTLMTTMTPTTWRPATTRSPVSTVAPTTPIIPSTCDIGYSVTSLIMKTFNIMNFNFLSLNDRQSLCKSYDESITKNLDETCPSELVEVFDSLSERMIKMASDVCDVFITDQHNQQKCSEVVQCVMNVGNFTNKNTSCRSIKDAVRCLKSHFEYCDVTGQMSINNTVKLLHDMDFIICEPNKLLKAPDVECVNMTVKNSSELSCDVSMAMECGNYIHKAMHNPFMQQMDFCRLVKSGMVCIRDNTYNCPTNKLQNMTSYLGEIVHGIDNVCPDVWCPREEICSLEDAWRCMNSLHDDVEMMVTNGNRNKTICKSITKAHSCILNASRDCYMSDRQQLIYNFNMVTSMAEPFCNNDSINFDQCLNTFHHYIDDLINFDQDFMALMLKHKLRDTLKTYVWLMHNHNDETEERSDRDWSMSEKKKDDQKVDIDHDVPSMFSFLLKGDRLERIDVPSFLMFLSEVMPNTLFTENNVQGYGLNMLQSYGFNMSDLHKSDTSREYSMTLGYDNYGSVSAFVPNIGDYIENITDILFGLNQDKNSMSTKNIIDQIEMILRLSDDDMEIRGDYLHEYVVRRSDLCASLHLLEECNELSYQWNPMSGEQRFLYQISMDFLHAVVDDGCHVKESQCHSCSGLHSNEECNYQPPTQCGPTEVCQSKMVDSHYYKGCSSKLSCEAECRQSSGPCFCCHGYMCNQYDPKEYAGNRRDRCMIQTAVDTVVDLLMFASNYTENDAIIQQKALTLVRSTAGCHDNYLKHFNREGQRLLKYVVEAKTCSMESRQSCDVKGYETLASLVTNPYHTIETISTMCRLYEHMTHELLNSNKTHTGCCTIEKSMITIYQHMNKLCDNVDITYVQELCYHIDTDRCMMSNTIHHSDNGTHGNVTGRDRNEAGTDRNQPGANQNVPGTNRNETGTNRNVTGAERDVTGNVSSTVMPETEDTSWERSFCQLITMYGDEVNNSTEEVEFVMPSCDMMSAIECLVLAENCSDISISDMMSCINTTTAGCSKYQMIPVSIHSHRVVLQCNVTDMLAQHDEISSPLQCLDSLSMILPISISGQIDSNICDVIEDVETCIEASMKDDLDQLDMIYINQVLRKMVWYKDVVCSNDNVDVDDRNTTYNGSCDITSYNTRIIDIVLYTLTDGFIDTLDNSCRMVTDIQALQEDIGPCDTRNNILHLLSEIQDYYQHVCTANMARSLCINDVCDLGMVEELVYNLGDYMAFNGMEDDLFCRQVGSILDGLKCTVSSCHGNHTSYIQDNIAYVRYMIQSRCYSSLDEDHHHCISDQTDLNITSNPGSHGNQTDTVGTCNINRAEKCLFKVQLPSQDDPLFCSKMLSTIDQLSDCVHPNLYGCQDDLVEWIETYYKRVLDKIKPSCNNIDVDFYQRLFNHGCEPLPLCSYSTAVSCILNLKHDGNETSCGNMEDIKQCIDYMSEGCNSVQTFALSTLLQSYAIQHHLPVFCWEDLIREDSNRTDGLETCIMNFKQDLTDLYVTEERQCPEIPDGVVGMCVEMCSNDTDCIDEQLCCSNGCGHVCMESVSVINTSPDIKLCDVMLSMVTCIDDNIDSQLDVVKDSFKLFTEAVKYPLQVVCMSEVSVPSKISRCNQEAVTSCLTSQAANSVLMPTFSQDAKLFCTEKSDISKAVGIQCMKQALRGCDSSDSQQFYGMSYFLESLTQLPGTCSKTMVPCSPELTTSCVNELNHALLHSDQRDICKTLRTTITCFKQTLPGCDSHVTDFFSNMYKPVICKGLTVCPEQIELEDEYGMPVKETSQCFDPTDSSIIIHGGTCNPSEALRCLQDTVMFTEGEDSYICSDYRDRLTCVFNNINGCMDDTVTKFVMYHIHESMKKYESMCDVYIKHDCKTPVHPCNCDVERIDACIHDFIDATKYGEPMNACMSKQRLRHCLEYNTEKCPRITRLFVEMKVEMVLAEPEDIKHNCDSTEQCFHDYKYLLTNTMKLTKSFYEVVKQASADTDDVGKETSIDTDAMAKQASNDTDGVGNQASNDKIDVNDRDDFTKQAPTDSDDVEEYIAMIKEDVIGLCHDRIDISACIHSAVQNLPADVVMVIDTVLHGIDHLMVDACSVLYGIQREIYECNMTCIDCLTESNYYIELLQLLYHLDGLSVNDTKMLMPNSTFCSEYEQWILTSMDIPTCSDSMTAWHDSLMIDVYNLYNIYCPKSCNTTGADNCVQSLQNIIDTSMKDEVCLSYNETFQCLNETLTVCDTEIYNEYIILVTDMLNNTGLVCYELPSLEVTYAASHMTLLEGGASQDISVTLTSEIKQICKGTTCNVDVFISSEDTESASCSSGDGIPGILIDRCSITFSENDTINNNQTIQVFARSDLRTMEPHNVTFNIVAQLWTDSEFSIESTLATVTMEIVDRDPVSPCYLISEPYILTFDGLDYYSFKQGEFILYQHDSLPEKVHVAFQRCKKGRRPVCPCAVLIQIEDDVFVIDTCRRRGEKTHPFEFKIYQNDVLPSDVTIFSTEERKSFDIVLPSGAIVYVRAAGDLLDVWIKPSARDWAHTSGLCGNTDGISENDLTLSDGSTLNPSDVRKWRRVILPDDFVSSWKATDTLFGGIPAEFNLTADVNVPNCVCVNDTCIETSTTETCGFTSGEDITNNLDIYIQDTTSSVGRRKRQIVDIASIIDFDEDNDTALPDWPTQSGFNENLATFLCESGLTGHELYDTCSAAINTSLIIELCVTNVLLTDSSEPVQDSIQTMKTECMMTVMSDPSIAIVMNMTPDDLVAYVTSFSCVNDCSDNGQCVNDECECNVGYGGEDCSLSIEIAPTVYSISQSLFTDDLTQSILIYGEAFISTNTLTCHLTDENGQSETSSAMFLTGGTIQCDATGSLPYSNLQLSISNNGVNQSNSVAVIFYDSVCYVCNETSLTCVTVSTSCVIEGVCYAPGDYNPSDNCLLCDPISNQWKFKPSATCLTTSTSTVSTTSTSPSSTQSTSGSTSSVSSPTTSKATSPSTSRSSSVSSSTSTDSPSSGTTSGSSSGSTPSSTSSINESDGQGGAPGSGDSETLTIVIIVSCVAGLILIIAVIVFATLMRRKDSKRGSEIGSMPSTSDDDPGKYQGQRAPPGGDGGIQIIQQQQLGPGYIASFDPQGLGQPATRAIYTEPYDSNVVDVAMFEDGNMRREEGETRRVGEVVIEPPYNIPRPAVTTAPVVQLERPYDNFKRRNDVPKSSMADYYENDSEASSTRL